MIKLRKLLVKFLAKLGITPYVYYTFKWNDPFIIKKKIFKDKSDLVIFDVGAFDGRSIVMYKKIFTKSNIYSFEPTPAIFGELSSNYKNNPDIKLFNVALSSEVGNATFFVNNSLLTNSLYKTASNDYTNSNSNCDFREEIKVKTTTIDEICSIHNISKINILKLDVQGAEELVLMGAEKTLNDKKIDLIYVEVEFLQIYENQPLFHNISLYLYTKGYYLYSLYNMSVSEKGQMIYGDAVFLSPNIKV